jgi:hypothetical protein
MMKDLKERLNQIALDFQLNPEYIFKLYALEGLVRRTPLMAEADKMIIRGSFITSNWVKPHFRAVNDLDFLADYPIDTARGESYIRQLLTVDLADGLHFFPNELQVEDTWTDTPLPGQRYQIPARLFDFEFLLQIDLAFNDPLIPPAIWWEYPALLSELSTTIRTVRPELALAWKVHGLFEFWDKGGTWQIKDLYDIYLIIKTQILDNEVFREALRIAFSDRNTPMHLYQRVLAGEFGQSTNTRKHWQRFVNKMEGKLTISSHFELLAEVRKYLDGFFIKA